jgi:hypothetical protein
MFAFRVQVKITYFSSYFGFFTIAMHLAATWISPVVHELEIIYFSSYFELEIINIIYRTDLRAKLFSQTA